MTTGADSRRARDRWTATAAAGLTALTVAACGTGSRAQVTFVLKNSHSQELAFNMDHGWQPNLFAYTGKPPRAKSILMFPKHCSASCAAPASERCPSCAEPEKPKDQIAAQKFERVAPGDELEVPWDGRVFVYEKTRGRRNGKRRRCQCHRTEPAPPATYTVKACGLRLTKTAGQRSRLQCVEAEMTMPSSGRQRIELDFGDPRPRGGEPSADLGRPAQPARISSTSRRMSSAAGSPRLIGAPWPAHSE